MNKSVKSDENKINVSTDYEPLPYLPAPLPGETLQINVVGEPPLKDIHFSIRNPKHKKHHTFQNLRQQAIVAMAGKKWYDGPVELALTLYAPACEKSFVDYLGGIADTLDGSHGFTFTYLPIVYQDDCQIVTIRYKFMKSAKWKYRLKVKFLR